SPSSKDHAVSFTCGRCMIDSCSPKRYQGVFVSARVFRCFLLAGLISAIHLWAQLTVSTLRGTATDQTGAVVVNARIRAVHQETNLTREVDTNENGDFEILDLPRGSYKLTATHPGFKTFVADNIVLESSQIRRINV